MISFILSLVRDFENEHNVRPNLVYLNTQHFEQMKKDFDPEILAGLINRLEMELLIDDEVAHPHVAWMPMVCAQGMQ